MTFWHSSPDMVLQVTLNHIHTIKQMISGNMEIIPLLDRAIVSVTKVRLELLFLLP